MEKSLKSFVVRLVIYAVISSGVVSVVFSFLYTSTYAAVLGVTMVFWSAIFLYLTPTKYVPLTLLNAAEVSAITNLEKIFSEADLNEKGRYLPPKYSRDFETILLFIPKNSQQTFLKRYEVTGDSTNSREEFMFVTPPGLALSNLFEKELGVLFATHDIDFVQQKLPKLLVEDMELAQTADLKVQNDVIVLELKGNLLAGLCRETRKLPRTHNIVGCLLSSAVACVLAKASGKVVTIQKDELSEDDKITRLEYRLGDE